MLVLSVIAGLILGGNALGTCEVKNWTADSWEAPPSNCTNCDNIVPFYWLYWDQVEANVTQVALDAINATSSQRHAGLFSWTMHRDMPSDPADNIFPVGGGPNCTGKDSNFSGIWWDHGVQTTLSRFEMFFKEYAALGGKCDRFVIDAEEWLNNWVLIDNPGPPPFCHQQRARAIANDPRWSDVEPRLVAAGFQMPPPPQRANDPDWLYNAIRAPSSQYHIFNNVMLNFSATYFNRALFDPLRQYFPSSDLSNYDYMIYNGSASQCVPDLNGNLYCETSLHLRGALNGNVASPSIYMHFGSGFTSWARSTYNLTDYPLNPFNAFRWGVMQVRSLVIAGKPAPGGSVIPVRPWVSPKSWSGTAVNNSVFYDEAMFHLALAGSQDFNFWNYNHNGTDVEALSSILHELDEVVGCAGRQPAFPVCPPDAPLSPCPQAIQFDKGYVLTGSKNVGSDGSRVRYRLTVASGTPSQYIQPGPQGALVFAIPSIGTAKPTTCTITIPSAMLMDSASDADSGPGVWIDQDGTALPASVTCDTD